MNARVIFLARRQRQVRPSVGRMATRLGLALLPAALWAWPAAVGIQQTAPTGRYYSESGHNVDARFLDSYDQLGGTRILGLPITESFYTEEARLLQYFENARFELTPDAEGTDLQAELTPLGVILGGWDLPLSDSSLALGAGGGCRHYEETGHQVCHAFLDFYEANGGPEVFGYPITEFRLEDERIVQYFENLRLDWYPEAEQAERIRTGQLGQAHFELLGFDPMLLEPVNPPEGEEYIVSELRPHASVLKPLVKATDSQHVYLVVSDQHMRPVQGAAVLLTVYLPDGPQMQMLPSTDPDGVTQTALTVFDLQPGTLVELEYTVLYRGLTALIRDSFLVWY